MPFYPADPFYEHGPAGWVKSRAEGVGLRVRIDPNLETPGFASLERSILIARPGLSFPTFHWLVACGIIANMFGPDAAPELPVAQPPVHNAQIIPFQRPPFAAGTWRH
jgi:hypothetical protein